VCASPAQEDEKLPPAPYETVKDAPGSNVDGEGAQWSSGMQTQGERAWQRKHAGCMRAGASALLCDANYVKNIGTFKFTN
jgi:hypothetical protein